MLPFPPDAVPPLAGIRVLDAARVLAGPFCGQTLADLGAEVVKLERPGTGDDTRAWGPPFRGPLSAYFLSCNRSKRSVTLDIQHPDGSELFHQLLAKSDVLIGAGFFLGGALLGHGVRGRRHPAPRLVRRT